MRLQGSNQVPKHIAMSSDIHSSAFIGQELVIFKAGGNFQRGAGSEGHGEERMQQRHLCSRDTELKGTTLFLKSLAVTKIGGVE